MVPLEKKLITAVNSVTAKEEKLPALVRKVINYRVSLNVQLWVKLLYF